ncbi:MAG: TonB-dependent receptor, partial [Flavobacteriales bacterium]|nr:TonB-dependent receptor [Flavobacteriales bacterium]
MLKKLILTITILLPHALFSQNVIGKVTNVRNEPLIGANVYWSNTSFGITTGVDGQFELSKDHSNNFLVASFIGYTSDTIDISNQKFVVFKLSESKTLDEVVVEGERSGVFISDIEPAKIEQITQTELGKAACCDLAGCFETQSTVQPQTTNVITNTKELRILGLSGVYNQILVDGFPMIQGLTYTYGISSIPGTLVDNIYVSKGANSVLQGFESISGQINVETKEPDNTDRLFLNAYINSFSEKHFNTNFAVKKGKWSNLIALHSVQPSNEFDRDNDNFLDLPKLTRYMISNKLKYGNQNDWGWNSKIGFRMLNEQRIGGQTNFNHDRDKGSSNVYGQVVQINQPEVWTKTGYRLNDNHNFLFFGSSFYQDQNSYFGTVRYDADQLNIYSNFQYEFQYKNNLVKAGVSFRYLDITENISFTENTLLRSYSGEYSRHENIFGIFGENTLKLLNDKLTWIAGIRLDKHNQFGEIFTPRTLVKFDIKPNTIIRANIGRGWRT